jgi:hypothetical protein
LAAASAAGAVESTPVVLGIDGTTYRLWSGTFAEIFGANPALPPQTPILALDVAPSGQPLARYLVPGTEGNDTESSAVLLAEPGAGAVHLIWNTRLSANHVYSRLALRSYSPAGWSELTEISGGTFTDKTHLQVALANDAYSTKVDGVETRIARRALHLVWSESSNGISRSYYTPVLFLDGRYLGWNPIVALDDLAPNEAVAANPAPADLSASPAIALGADGRAVISFVHSTTRRLVTAEVQALPGELGELGELARGHIVELAGAGGLDRAQIAEAARGHIVELATRFHSAAAGYLGAKTADLLLAAPAEAEGSILGEMARGHIVELGREILGAGLANVCAGEGTVLEIPPLSPAPGTDFAHLLAIRRVASWELPPGISTGARLLTSASGDRLVLAWAAENRIEYRETIPSGAWSEVRSLDLAQMSIDEAWGALLRRASGL